MQNTAAKKSLMAESTAVHIHQIQIQTIRLPAIKTQLQQHLKSQIEKLLITFKLAYKIVL